MQGPCLLAVVLGGLTVLLQDAAVSAAEDARAPSPVPDRLLQAVEDNVRPVLERVSYMYNMSYTFAFTTVNGSTTLAAGLNNRWGKKAGNLLLQPEELIPLGSVTKPWTALLVMQAAESGVLSLSDPMVKYADPVVQRLWGVSLESMWGPKIVNVTIENLLGMTSGLADYADELLEKWTLQLGGEDLMPIDFIRSAAQEGFVCDPGKCASYSGVNYVMLGLVLVEATMLWSWQDLDQLQVVPPALWNKRRYPRTSFMKAGRCKDFPRIAHQFAAETWQLEEGHMFYNDLAYNSCLNGWTMGNIATTAEDLAKFFYDVFSDKTQGLYVNKTTLNRMQQYKTLSDKWCLGRDGWGSCKYGLGLFKDQMGQDVWPLLNPRDDMEAIRVLGHSGADWGSGCSPCGYNPTYGFGICVAYTSTYGMNCSNDWRINIDGVYEATCLIYDAVLEVLHAPRLNCSRGSHDGLVVLQGPPQLVQCKWIRNHYQRKRPRPQPLPVRKVENSSDDLYYYYYSYEPQIKFKLIDAGGHQLLNCSWNALAGRTTKLTCPHVNSHVAWLHRLGPIVVAILGTSLVCTWGSSPITASICGKSTSKSPEELERRGGRRTVAEARQAAPLAELELLDISRAESGDNHSKAW